MRTGIQLKIKTSIALLVAFMALMAVTSMITFRASTMQAFVVANEQKSLIHKLAGQTEKLTAKDSLIQNFEATTNQIDWGMNALILGDKQQGLRRSPDMKVNQTLVTIRDDWDQTCVTIADFIKAIEENDQPAIQRALPSLRKSYGALVSHFDRLTNIFEGKIKNESEDHKTSQISFLIFALALGATTFAMLNKGVIRPIQILAEKSRRIASGDSKRAIVIRTRDEINEIASSINTLFLQLTKVNSSAEPPAESRDNTRREDSASQETFKDTEMENKNNIDTLITGLEQLAEGDLTVKLSAGSNEDEDKLAKRFNKATAHLNGLLAQIDQMMKQAAQASSSIVSGAGALAAGAEKQTLRTVEIVSTVDFLNRSTDENTKHTDLITSAAQEMRKNTQGGQKIITEFHDALDSIADTLQDSTDTLSSLASLNTQISEISKAIGDISDQAATSESSLERTGKNGVATAVDDIKALANRTASLAEKTEQIVTNMKTNINSVVGNIALATLEINRGQNLVSHVENELKPGSSQANGIIDIINQVNETSERQSLTTFELKRDVEMVGDFAQEQATESHSIAQEAGALQTAIQSLQDTMLKFQIDNDALHLSAEAETRSAGSKQEDEKDEKNTAEKSDNSAETVF